MDYRHPVKEKESASSNLETACPLQAESRFHAARILEPDDCCHMLQSDTLGNRMKRSYEPHRPWSYKLSWPMKPWPDRMKNRLPVQIVGTSVPLRGNGAQNERHPGRPDQGLSLFGDVTQ